MASHKCLLIFCCQYRSINGSLCAGLHYHIKIIIFDDYNPNCQRYCHSKSMHRKLVAITTYLIK